MRNWHVLAAHLAYANIGHIVRQLEQLERARIRIGPDYPSQSILWDSTGVPTRLRTCIVSAPYSAPAGHVHRAWTGQRDRHFGDDAARSFAEHDDAVGQEDGFGNAVRDHQHGHGLHSVNAQQLQVDPFAGQRVQRAERLIHEQQLGMVDERAGQDDTLRHAAGQVFGIDGFEAVEAEHVQELRVRGASVLFVALSWRISRGSSTFCRTVRQGIRLVDWKTKPMSVCGSVSGDPSKRMAPLSGGIKPPTMRSRVLLPLPLGPSRQTNSPARCRS